MPTLLGLIVREAGKSLPNAIAEVREAVDFLRYYAAAGPRDFANDTHRPLGPVVCISPWNFPLAIFTGQVARGARGRQPGARQAGRGNAADRRRRPCASCTRPACRARRCSSCPATATVGAALVADPTRRGRDVHRLDRGGAADPSASSPSGSAPTGKPIPLIAETGGQNAHDRRFLGAARAGRAATS